jgi:hypothetical protein
VPEHTLKYDFLISVEEFCHLIAQSIYTFWDCAHWTSCGVYEIAVMFPAVIISDLNWLKIRDFKSDFFFFYEINSLHTRHELLWSQWYGPGSQHQPMDRVFRDTGIDWELGSEISDTVNNITCRCL